MSITILTRDNIKELHDKEILIYFESDLGAMGCPGLNFIIFTDGSIYAYSKMTDCNQSIKMGAQDLIFSNIERNVSLIYQYLGYGNHTYINKKIYDEYRSLINRYRYIAFREILKKYSKYDIFDIYDKLPIK